MKKAWFGLALLLLGVSACASTRPEQKPLVFPSLTPSRESRIQVVTPEKHDSARPPFNTTPQTPSAGNGEVRVMPAPRPLPKAHRTPLPFPQPNDAKLRKDVVYVQAYSVKATRDGKIVITLKGNLPTPCHQLRVNFKRMGAQVQIEVYSLIPPQKLCTENLKPFVEEVKIGPFPDGEYQIFINGKKAGTIEVKSG